MNFYFFIFIELLASIAGAVAFCGKDETTSFSRWSGMRADQHASPVFVYAARGDEPSLTSVCVARCRELSSCAAVSMQPPGHCIGLPAEKDTLLLNDNDSAYYEKICIPSTNSCGRRWWSAESTPGYRLHADGRNLKIIINVTTVECYSAVLATAGGQYLYRSAQWVANEGEDGVGARSGGGTAIGNCVLNVEDKYTEPESYRVANFNTLYIENQCRHDYPEKIDRCSYEEYFNQTLKHVELALLHQTNDECKRSCEMESRFVCRGFTWKEDVGSDSTGECSLHSEDLVTVGSWLLKKLPGAVYYRRVLCLNLSVECGPEEMVVTYRPRGLFRGRVYVPGKAERCSAGGRGGRVVLKLPLQGDCDVNYAHAITSGPSGVLNRTIAYAMVMIQNNPIIQTAGDRWVRVGCSLTPPATHVDAALAVHNNGNTLLSETEVQGMPHTGASAVFNNTRQTPITMYIVRVGNVEGNDVIGREGRSSAVSLGELLELRIESTDDNSIEAYHLVASSRLGDSSVLLLDSRGCPTGQVDFPQLTSVHISPTMQRLRARFKAFRFPTSHVVRFAIMVRNCDNQCPKRECDNKGRSARGAESLEGGSDNRVDATVKEESGFGGVVAQSGGVGPGSMCGQGERVPLELELVVGSKDLLTADTLVQGDHEQRMTASVGGNFASVTEAGVVCVHEALLVAVSLVWLAVQVLLLVGCCVLVKRYRNLAEINMHKDYQTFDNIGFESYPPPRRVHWPDQHVEILRRN